VKSGPNFVIIFLAKAGEGCLVLAAGFLKLQNILIFQTYVANFKIFLSS